MKKSEKRSFIIQTLENLYPKVDIPLDHINDFTFLIAVMLSAQSTDKKVNEITPDLFSLAPTPAKMVDLGISRIKKHIRQIGLAPTKAKNIFKTSEILIEKFNSKVPDNFEDLESLPGVGHKTSSVIMSQIFKV
ncbi:endonuclease III, partial [Bacteroidota bacterium]|nr:endonuclease III [Bacteroidota bacterium]